MKIYVTGLIFFNGCNEDVKGMFAPDGRQDLPEGIPVHQASLWIAQEYLAEGTEDEWWPDIEERAEVVRPHVLDGVAMVEFRIPEPVDLTFPDENNAFTCDQLDQKLPKLKKKKNAATIDFEVDPDEAVTIAEVTINGGQIEPRQMQKNKKKIGVVVWTIPEPSGLQIIATLQEDESVAGTITLNDPEAEIVFANTHDLFTLKANGKDALAGTDHVALFQKLNPDADASVFSVKSKKNAPLLVTEEPLLSRLKLIDFTCGETPPCCPN